MWVKIIQMLTNYFSLGKSGLTQEFTFNIKQAVISIISKSKEDTLYLHTYVIWDCLSKITRP